MDLYPYSEIVITSSTIAQGNKLVEKKIRDELIKKLSPVLLYMYDKEYLVITKSDDGYKIENKLSGSTLSVLPCLDSARGERATMLIYEEARLLKKTVIDSVFEKMAHPRQAKYLSNPKYSNNTRWKEECQHIYMTSTGYSYEWFYLMFKNTFTRHFTDKYSVANIYAGDIFTAIDNGFKTWGDYRNGRNGNEMEFRIEDLNETVSESEDSFFEIKSFKNNQTLKQCFRSLTMSQYYGGNQVDFPEKASDEIRLIAVDIAFSGQSTAQRNDHTVMICMSLHWKKRGYERHIDNIEVFPGGQASERVLRIRELFEDYQADYLCLDIRSGGEAYFDYLTNTLQHPYRTINWNQSGLTVANEKQIHVVSSAKLEELRSRTIDKNARPVIVPIQGTSELNSNAWKALKRSLESGTIKFLIPMEQRQEIIEDDGTYYDMNSEQLAEDLAPYGQTDMLIQECINLHAEFREGLVKLKEPATGYKDRAVTLAYANMIADKIENIYSQSMQSEEINIDDIQLVW